MNNTVGQALVQVILDLEAALPAAERFTLTNGIGGDPNPQSDYAPYLLFKAGTARVGFDASKLSSASCATSADGDLAGRLCYCIEPTLPRWVVAEEAGEAVAAKHDQM